MSRNLPYHDLDTVRRIAGDRSGIIFTTPSDVCVNVADLPTEDLWLIIQALENDDFVKTTTHQTHGQIDTYCIPLNLRDFHLDLFVREEENEPILIVISLERL